MQTLLLSQLSRHVSLIQKKTFQQSCTSWCFYCAVGWGYYWNNRTSVNRIQKKLGPIMAFYFFLLKETMKIFTGPQKKFQTLNTQHSRWSQKYSMPAISLFLLVGIQGTERGKDPPNVIIKRSFHQNEMVKTILTALIDISFASWMLRKILIIWHYIGWILLTHKKK